MVQKWKRMHNSTTMEPDSGKRTDAHSAPKREAQS